MPRLKISESKVEKFIKDELEGFKTYLKYGFKSQAKDEKRHSKYFRKKYKKLEKAEKKRKKKK